MILGTIVSDLKKAAEAVKEFFVKAGEEAPKVVQDVVAAEEKIAPVLEAFLPGSAGAIALGNSILDAAAQVVEDASGEVQAVGTGVSLDLAPFKADLQKLIAAAKAAAAKL